MEDDKLYRIRAKDGAHFNKKTDEDGWSSAIQFDDENGLQGPLEYQEVDASEYTREVYVESEQRQQSLGEKLIEEAVAPAVANALTYVLERAVDAGFYVIETKVIPAAKAKGKELIDKAKSSYQEQKKKKLDEKEAAIVVKTKTEMKQSTKNKASNKSVEHTPEEVEQIVNNMRMAAMFIAAGINELSRTVVKSEDPDVQIEMQQKLDELSTEQVMKSIDYMLEDSNRDKLDQATIQLFEAFRNRELIIDGEKIPISKYIVSAS